MRHRVRSILPSIHLFLDECEKVSSLYDLFLVTTGRLSKGGKYVSRRKYDRRGRIPITSNTNGQYKYTPRKKHRRRLYIQKKKKENDEKPELTR